MSKLKRLAATAYHEAGHAVVAKCLNVPLNKRGVSIIPDDDSFGRADITKGFRGSPELIVSDRRQRQIENRIVVALAGMAAQRKHRPSSVRSHHALTDIENALTLLSYLSGSERQMNAYFQLLRIRAEELVAYLVWWMRRRV